MNTSRPIRFVIAAYGIMQEVFVPPIGVDLIIRAAEHEAAHVVAAHELNAEVLGIALGFLPERTSDGMMVYSLYGWRHPVVEDQCVTLAAGPAADNNLYYGGINLVAASNDLKDIGVLTGQESLEPYLPKATDILVRRASVLKRIAEAMRDSLSMPQKRTLGVLERGNIGVLLLNETELGALLDAA